MGGHTTGKRTAQAAPALEKSLRQLNLNPSEASFEERLDSVDGYLCELKEAQIRTGLHIYGMSLSQINSSWSWPSPVALGQVAPASRVPLLRTWHWTVTRGVMRSNARLQPLINSAWRHCSPIEPNPGKWVMRWRCWTAGTQCLRQGSSAFPGEQTRQVFAHINRVIQPALLDCSGKRTAEFVAGCAANG